MAARLHGMASVPCAVGPSRLLVCSPLAPTHRLPSVALGACSTSAAFLVRPSLAAKQLRSPGVSVVEVPRGRTAPLRASATEQQPAASSTPAVLERLGLMPELQAALAELHITEPTEIQLKAVPAIMSGGDYVLASHTGSGKTLAYLLPIIQMIKKQEQESGYVGRPKRPRALILGPTKELTEQIAGVAKTLSHFAKFRAMGLVGSKSRRQQTVQLSGPIDIVVSTPTKFLQHVKEGNVYYKDITWLVVDEADTILADKGWAAELKSILVPLRARPDRPKADVVLVSATMSKPIRRLIATDFPGVRMLETDSLHKGISGSKHRFVTMPPGRDKFDLLDEVLAPDTRQAKKVLVFCNTVDSCRALEHHCREGGVDTVCYHGDMPVSLRQEAMQKFAGTADNKSNDGDFLDGSGAAGAGRQLPGASSSGRQPVMIATDVAARGLDFPRAVDHVVNFDFPPTAVDYIHRSGRTARAGRTGKVTSLVAPRDKTLAQRVEWALQHGEALDQLSADPRVLPPSQRPKPGAEKERRRETAVAKGTRGAARLALGRPGASSRAGVGAKVGAGAKGRPAGPGRSAAGSGKAAAGEGRARTEAGGERGRAAAGRGGGQGGRGGGRGGAGGRGRAGAAGAGMSRGAVRGASRGAGAAGGGRGGAGRGAGAAKGGRAAGRGGRGGGR